MQCLAEFANQVCSGGIEMLKFYFFPYCCDLLMKVSFDFKYICNISLEDPSPEQACDSAPCLNNGSCIEVSDVSFVCACRDGFYGITCEQSELFSSGGKLFC